LLEELGQRLGTLLTGSGGGETADQSDSAD
jgi:hypothetical protein